MRAPALLLTLMLAAPAAAQPVIYVRHGATGAADGSSWADAFPDVQPALMAATPPAQVWVATGTYRPTNGTNRDATFSLASGVALYGGFDGTETALEDRDHAANETVLSGEIGETDEFDDNSCHVVTASATDSTGVLDGFSVTGGYPGFCAFNGGGGLLVEGGIPTVRNTRFHGNIAVVGGGVYNRPGSAGTFTDCLIDSNRVGNSGGGMGNEGSSPRLTRVTFRGNLAAMGGGMTNGAGAAPVCVDCTFEGNIGTSGGGGVFNELGPALLVRATFLQNSSGAGGGALRIEEQAADLVCIGCLFRENASEDGAGGAVYVRFGARPAFVNSTFEANHADDGAGGAVISDSGSEPLFVNTVFVGNTASSGGGAIFLSGTQRLVNVTVAGNQAQTGGAAIEVAGGAVTVLNSILWGNALAGGAPDGVLLTSGSFTMQDGLLEGACTPPLACEDVIDADPLFVRAPFADGPGDYGDLRLQVGSPALDAGDVAWLPEDVWDLDADGDTTEALPLDILGELRLQGPEIDLGAYEGGVIVASESGAPAPSLALAVAPNPAAGPVTVTLDLPMPATDVRVSVHDVLGRQVGVPHAGPLRAGRHAFAWGAGAARGVYFVRATAAGRSARAALTLVR